MPFYVIALTGGAFGGFILIFSNLNAAILLFGNRARSTAFQRIWIPVYNVSFVLLPTVWLGIAIVRLCFQEQFLHGFTACANVCFVCVGISFFGSYCRTWERASI